MSLGAPPDWKQVLKAIGWSVAFLAIGLAISIVLVSVAAYALHGDLQVGFERFKTLNAEATAVQGASQLGGFLVATWVVGVRACGLDGRKLRWQGGRRGLSGLGMGLALGAVAAVGAIGGAVLIGAAFWSRDSGTPVDYLTQVVKTAAVLAPAALSEEVVFRGVPLVLLAAAIGRRWALLIVAAGAFSLLHGPNPGITPLAFVNIALAGLWLGIAFYAPGGIWTAFGAHLGWNAALAALDAPVSGLPFRIPLLDYHAGDPCWLSGCRFGPEGGILATAALVAALLVARRWARKEIA